MSEFPGRSHYTCGQDPWEEIADQSLAWAEALFNGKPQLTLAA